MSASITRRELLLSSAALALAGGARGQSASGGAVGLRFKTDADLLRRLLPPGFEFVEPLAQIDFGGSPSAYWLRALVRAKAGDEEGWLPVNLWTSDERELRVAREGFGLGAQLADISMEQREGGGYVARLKLDGEIVLELTVTPGGGHDQATETEQLLFPAFVLDPDWRSGPLNGEAEIRRLAWGPAGRSDLPPSDIQVEWKLQTPLAPASELPIVEPEFGWKWKFPALEPGGEAPVIASASMDSWTPLRYGRPASQGRVWRPEGWPEERTATRLSEGELTRLRERKETQLDGLEIVTVEAMISRETHEALLPPPCRGASRPMIKVLGVRINAGDGVTVPYDELWLFAFSIVEGRAAWYALSHVVGPGGDITAGRETFGYPSRRGEPKIVVTPIDCSLSGDRNGREFVYADGAFQGFASGVSLDQLPIVGLRMKPGSRIGELVYQQWTFQGRRYRMEPRTIGLDFPEKGEGPKTDPWFQLGPFRPATFAALDGAALQRSPGVVIAEVADPAPYYRERCDGVLPWESAPDEAPQPTFRAGEPASRS